MSKNSTNAVENSAVENHGSAAFQKKYLWADLQAGVITATMAIPLSIGIALMSGQLRCCMWSGLSIFSGESK